jgi:hypothetical protein
MTRDTDLDALLRADRDAPLPGSLAAALLAARPKPRPRAAPWVAVLAAAVAAVAGAVALNANQASSVEEELWISIDGGLETAPPAGPES